MQGAHDDGDDEPRDGLIDFGSGVTGRFYGWHPDRTIQDPAWLERFGHLPDVEKHGMSFNHARPDNGARCGGYVTFDSEVARTAFAGTSKWTVESWEPMTLSPSILCRSCGRHGFIRQGKWVEA
jgi:hypothetical protein